VQTLPTQLNDLTGQKFGRLTAMEWLGRQGGGTKWRCLCACGTWKEVFAGALHSGKTLSCRCLNDEVREQNRPDRIGQRRGALTVTARASISPLTWLCTCDCGAKVVQAPENLRKRKICSPKCPKRTWAPPATGGVSTPGSGANVLRNQYRSDAKKRNLEFTLALDFFLELTSAPCTYCESPPELLSRYRETRPYTYNGIDRVDNERGYLLGNVVPCCYRCNRAKGPGELRTFLAWLTRLGATPVPAERFSRWGVLLDEQASDS